MTQKIKKVEKNKKYFTKKSAHYGLKGLKSKLELKQFVDLHQQRAW